MGVRCTCYRWPRLRSSGRRGTASYCAFGEMSTITIPDPLPTPEEDSEKLRKAFQGWGTDESAIIKILGHRTARQRCDIAEAYRRLYNQSLVDRLQSELSGDFKKAVCLWALDPAERDAKLANEALKKNGDQHVLVIIEIACASSSDHLMAVRKAYCLLFATSLEEDIELYFAQQQSLRQLLVRLVTSYRYDGEHVDDALAKAEAAELHTAIQNKQPHSEEVIRIIGTRNKSQLATTFQHYKEDYGRAIDEDLERNASSDKFQLMLKVAIWCTVSPEEHFAEVARSSIVGLGTDEESLTRVIVTRAEIDMKKIKDEYKQRYNTTLNSDVTGDTSGYYKDFLITLVGIPKP